MPGIGPKTAQRLVFHLLHFPQEEIEKFAENLIKFKADTQVCKICKNVGESNPCEICADDARDISSIAVVSTPLDVFALERAGFKGKYHVLHGVIDPLNNIGPEQLFINDLVSRLKSILSGVSSSEVLSPVSKEITNDSTSGTNVDDEVESTNDINSALGDSSDAFDALDELFEATFNDVTTDMGIERASEDEFVSEGDASDHSQDDGRSESPVVKAPKVTQIELILATGTSMEGESTAMYLTKLLRDSGLNEDKLKITRIARGLPVGGDIEYADDVTLLRALEGRSQY